jgi:hypothetical protein
MLADLKKVNLNKSSDVSNLLYLIKLTAQRGEKSTTMKTLKEKRVLPSISPTFYVQLLRIKIKKAQKDTDDLTVLLQFWDLRP